MKVERESFVRFAVAVALACYDLPADRAMTSDEAARLVKGVIDMALGPAASGVLVEPTVMSISIRLTKNSAKYSGQMEVNRCANASGSLAP